MFRTNLCSVPAFYSPRSSTSNTIRHRILHRLVLFFFGSISISSLCFRINYKASRVVPSYVVSFFSVFFCLGLWSPFGADFYSLSNLSADPATKKREQKIPLSRRMKIFKETNDPEQKKKKELLSFFFVVTQITLFDGRSFAAKQKLILAANSKITTFFLKKNRIPV